jgi:signal transduction histidine kinase/CheY-like chemotaxis protein
LQVDNTLSLLSQLSSLFYFLFLIYSLSSFLFTVFNLLFILLVHKKKTFVAIPFIFSFLVILAVSLYANSLISFSMRTMEYNIEHRLVAESKRLANIVGAEELDKYRDIQDMESPEYHALRKRLLDFSLEADILYAYYIRPVKDGLQYIVDNDFNEETRVGLDTPPYDPRPVPWMLFPLEGKTVCSGLGNYTPGWEGLLSGYAPVFDNDGNITAIAGVDIEDEPIVQARRLVSILTAVQIIAVAAIFVSGIIYFVYLNRQAEIAREASAAKSWFLSQMSHEIRTPLNAVIGLSEIELQRFKANNLPDSTRDNISRIRQSGVSLLGMINDILDISKIEANRFQLVPAVYETAPLLSDTINLNKVRIGSKPITLKLEINNDFPVKLIGDELRVRQILNNLLSNAIKYTQEGTVTLNVLCETIPDNQNVIIRFTVQDTGIGIRVEDMGKLFTSYTQLDINTNRKIEGTGLGLTITKRLVEMMGGSISVESEYGKGSVFTAQIIQGVDGADGQANVIGEETACALREFRYATEKNEAIVSRLWLPNSKVLVVDDIPDNLHVAQSLLAPYGLQVDTAVSGREAIEKAKTCDYDIIFMDHMMPEMDGIETAKEIKNRKEKIKNTGEQVPIIALTANALRGMREIYLEKGFDDYLSKPISPEALDDIIKKFFYHEPHELVPSVLTRTENHGADLGGRDDSQQELIMDKNSSPYSLEIEARKLDKLNHYRAAFEMSKTSNGLEIDTEYYRRFTSLVESFDTLPVNLQADKAFLIEAGLNEDAQKILRVLPTFCENITAMHQEKVKNEGTKNEIVGKILQRLKKAIEDGDTSAAGKIVKEMSAKSLTPEERELYFKLYDLLMDDNAQKALETIDDYLVG